MEFGNPDRKASTRLAIVKRARTLLGTKYIWGAEVDADSAKTGLDCSELTEVCFCGEDCDMPDGAVNQFAKTRPFDREPQPADLAFLHFFSQKSGRMVWHVGIRTERETIVHASYSKGRVVEDPASYFEEHEGFKGYRAHPDLL